MLEKREELRFYQNHQLESMNYGVFKENCLRIFHKLEIYYSGDRVKWTPILFLVLETLVVFKISNHSVDSFNLL